MFFFLFTIASVSASEIENTVTNDTNHVDLPVNNEIIKNNTQTDEINVSNTPSISDKVISSIDSQKLSNDTSTYSELSREIAQGGNVKLQHAYYIYDFGETIEINTEYGVIDGNGAVIDMAGSTIRSFTVNAYGVTIKNLTIINANIKNERGAIFFVRGGNVDNCNFVNNTASYEGGALWIGAGTVENSNFINNSGCNAGAIQFQHGSVINSNFINNTASSNGGALAFWNDGTLLNCNFTDNKARNGGAVYFINKGFVDYCNFTGNTAVTGSAIYFSHSSCNKNVFNSIFLKNRANIDFKTPFTIDRYGKYLKISFSGRNNIFNAIYSMGDITAFNITYWGPYGIRNCGDIMTPARSNNEAGQNITVSLVVDDQLVLNNVTMSTDALGRIEVNVYGSNNYLLSICHNTDSYYEEAKTLIKNMDFHAEVISLTTHNRTVNITATSNIFQEIIKDNLTFILSNGDEIAANYSSNGIWWAVYEFDDVGVYDVALSYGLLNNMNCEHAVINIINVDSSSAEDVIDFDNDFDNDFDDDFD